MLKITIELFPFGSEGDSKVLGTMKIWNKGDGTLDIGNYEYRMLSAGNESLKAGEVNKFPRKKLNAWDLLFRVLYDAVGIRNDVPTDNLWE